MHLGPDLLVPSSINSECSNTLTWVRSDCTLRLSIQNTRPDAPGQTDGEQRGPSSELPETFEQMAYNLNCA